ncbi:MAG: hypothetical protein E7172_03825 [Firmicutes bacterium]|nr:hypothetical protein [Bacillota bacterium]
MNIATKIIITDTNIITDLDNANILEQFINLDNVYISDMVKNDEINSKTGNVKLIVKIKVISATPTQLVEVSNLSGTEKKLSAYDLLNYVIARDNNCILATGDNRLKNYSEKNGVEVFRTLKIIKLMKEHNVISYRIAVDACYLLNQFSKTRIPEEDIDNLIKELEKDSVTV